MKDNELEMAQFERGSIFQTSNSNFNLVPSTAATTTVVSIVSFLLIGLEKVDSEVEISRTNQSVDLGRAGKWKGIVGSFKGIRSKSVLVGDMIHLKQS